MPIGFEEKQKRAFEMFLSLLDERSEFFGLLGRGFPHSFYKVYARLEHAKRWWLVDRKWAALVPYDPIINRQRTPISMHTGAVWAPLGDLLQFEHIDGVFLEKLFARTKALVGTPQQRVTLIRMPPTSAPPG